MIPIYKCDHVDLIGGEVVFLVLHTYANIMACIPSRLSRFISASEVWVQYKVFYEAFLRSQRPGDAAGGEASEQMVGPHMSAA